MATQKGLGRGLGALFGELAAEDPAAGDAAVQTLPIQKVEPNPQQPRKAFDEEELQALSESIALHGLLQPLAVRKLDTGFYQIIAGERRWRAARMAGLREVPVVVVQADDKTAAALALVENLQRQDLNPIEEAEGFRRLIEDFGLTQEQASEQVGRSRSAVTNALRLLSLPKEVRELLEIGALTAGHARAVLSLKSEQLQMEAASRISAEQLSVRQAEALCRRLSAEKPEPEPQPLAVDYLAECEKRLSKSLGRGVKIHKGRKKGRVELEYYNEDDLQRLFEALQTLGLGGEGSDEGG